ncbi:MAG: NUDIX hydrolase [Ignavibacteriaceae bacterium]
MMKIEFNFEQSAVIPYRKKNENTEVLLITSLRKKKWIVPKGYIEFNLTAFESAKKEAYEEAGVLGQNETEELGYLEVKKKVGLWHMKVYKMEVTELLDEYPEKEMRKRKWFPVNEAAEKVSIPGMKELILKLNHSN